MSGPTMPDAVRALLAQEASIPALRVSLFLFGILAAAAWFHRRPRSAFLLLWAASVLAIGYWLGQMALPFGLGSDPARSREWAQAGVNAFAESAGSGFIWGTDTEPSLISSMAARGVPPPLVSLLPQLAAFFCLTLLVLAPFGFLRNGTSAAFASCLVVSGGVWAGVPSFGKVLENPSSAFAGGAVIAILLIVSRNQAARRTLGRLRFPALLVLGGVFAVDRALEGGAEPSVAAVFLLAGGATMLASPFRASLRRIFSTSAGARRAEALLLLCAFGGSGLLWWNPPRTVRGFNETKNENAALLRCMDWIRNNVPPRSIVLASPEYSLPVAVFGGRRVLFSPAAEPVVDTALRDPFRRARFYASALQGRPLTSLAEHFSATHLLLGPGETLTRAEEPATTDGELSLRLVLVYQDAEDFRVYHFAPNPFPAGVDH